MTPTAARRAARALLAAFFIAAAVTPCRAANPSMSNDFARMMQWLSHEMVQGLAFNAGSTFDPPKELKDRRLQPDLSLGVGRMPLDKSKFPEPETAALQELGASSIFPDKVLFPNLTMHLRAGLPYRCDMAIRVANMTTPPGYKISPTTTGSGQSNSIGFGVRKHFFGEAGAPLLSLGANYNHVYGRFLFRTKFKVDDIQGFSADSNVDGTIQWSVNSYGVNAVLSHSYGRWTPFFGAGFNRVSGSVRARLSAISNTPLISPIVGEGSDQPEQTQGRAIVGFQLSRPWANLFANGEIKSLGISSGAAYIVHFGMSLPFHIGTPMSAMAKRRDRRSADRERVARRRAPAETETADAAAPRARRIRPARELLERPAVETAETMPELIFIQ